MGNIRVKLIGEDPELDRVKAALKSASYTVRQFTDLTEACEVQQEEPSEVFVFGPSHYYQSHLNQIQKLGNKPEVMLACGTRLPNLAKILVPHLIYGDWSDEEITWELQLAVDFYRRSRRLEALRDHHKRSWNLDTNPAINLVTNLMKKCTISEDYRDLLSAVLAMRSVIDFHDASLVVLDGDNQPIEAWHSSREGKDRLREIPSARLKTPLAELPEGEVKLFSSGSPEAAQWDELTTDPWSFGLALRFSHGQALRNSKITRTAVLALYRRELLPFLERDFWLLEMTYGPLALALEKVSMLKAIGLASKEWRSTFDGISEPLTVIDSNYQIVKANRSFARLVNQDVKKLKGKRCYYLLAGRRSPCVGCPVGFEHQAHSGSRVQWQGKSKKDLLVWSYGVRTGMEGYHFQFYRNVSTEAHLTSTLIQSEKMAALGRLVGAVAHEINNPLAGILATSQILLNEADESGLDDSTRDDLEEIRSAAVRSKKIIDDLLGFTTSRIGQQEKANLLEVIRSTLTFSKAALREVQVKVDSADPEPLALVPVGALQQILFNLITNAAQAMNGKGSLELEVQRFERQAPGEGYRIRVKDSGPGIPPERLKHIFDPFYTSKQEGMGTGLGLSIVRSLTQKMNARIEVASVVGKGTEFILFLAVGEGTGKA